MLSVGGLRAMLAMGPMLKMLNVGATDPEGVRDVWENPASADIDLHI